MGLRPVALWLLTVVGLRPACSVELWPYVLGSWLGMLPGTYAYVTAGMAGRAVVMEGASEGMNVSPEQVGAEGRGSRHEREP